MWLRGASALVVLFMITVAFTPMPAVAASSPFTVSGLSSGAYMAVQLHVAYSARVAGAGIVAGGPYWCAMADVGVAVSSCMADPVLIDLLLLYAGVDAAELALSIDLSSNLATSTVWLYSGTEDTVVDPGVMKKLAEFYAHYNVQSMTAVFDRASEHGYPTLDLGLECDSLGTPFILRCNYSASTALLDTLYPGQRAARAQELLPTTASGSLLSVDQSFYLPDPWTLDFASVGSTAFVYVPVGCAADTSVCSVHVALHGCEQSLQDIGMDFVNSTGYMEWADQAGNVVILFPQCTGNLLNPKSCWDWWGYTGPDYATQLAPQPQMIVAMVDALQSNSLKLSGAVAPARSRKQ